MIMKLFFPASIVLLIAMNSACTKDKLAPTYAQVGICFETEILPIFISNCATAGCHNATDKVDGYDLTHYDGIMTGISAYDPANSKHIKYMERTDNERMPVPPMDPVSATSIALIKDWINKGAPNTVDCVVSNCDSVSNVSFSNTVLPIINTNCLGCHNTSSPGGGYNYSNYSGIKSSASNGSLLGSIKHQSPYIAMPLSAGKMSDCNIKQIETWINEGAANN